MTRVRIKMDPSKKDRIPSILFRLSDKMSFNVLYRLPLMRGG